jgi:hypothetical protein
MKISFGSYILGGGSNWYLKPDFKGLEAKIDNVAVRVPRTDYIRNITHYADNHLKAFSGRIVGNNVSNLRLLKRNLANEIGNTYTFTITDDIINADGTTTVYETYEITGKIIDVTVNDDFRTNTSLWGIQIYCEDPFFYLTTAVTDDCDIEPRGFTFPLIFPFVFSGRDNVMTLTNSGAIEIYPTITIHGALNNLEIVNETSSLTDKIFKYNSFLTESNVLVLTPKPNDPIKARKDGVSVIQYTNSNWDALKLKVGVNVLTFFLEEDSKGNNTKASISFKPGYWGI